MYVIEFTRVQLQVKVNLEDIFMITKNIFGFTGTPMPFVRR